MSIDDTKREIPPNTQDPLSAIFNLRRMNLDKPKEFQMNINTSQKNYLLRGKVSLRDLVINEKTYKTILVKSEISRRDNNPYHRSTVSMVLAGGKENIPIIIKVFASGILVNAKLIEIK